MTKEELEALNCGWKKSEYSPGNYALGLSFSETVCRVLHTSCVVLTTMTFSATPILNLRTAKITFFLFENGRSYVGRNEGNLGTVRAINNPTLRVNFLHIPIILSVLPVQPCSRQHLARTWWARTSPFMFFPASASQSVKYGVQSTGSMSDQQLTDTKQCEEEAQQRLS